MNRILKPFALLLVFFYNLFNNYGVALILFAAVVKVILFPFSLKGKRSMVKVSAVQGKAQRIQRQYANNKQKQQEELAKLYEKEQVNPMGGCLWSLLPLLILLPLYAIIRQPLTHMMSMGEEAVNAVAQFFEFDLSGNAYGQLTLASLITPENLESIKAAVGEGAKGIMAINFNFLGMDLSLIPTWKVWEGGLGSLAVNLLPIVSAALTVVSSIVIQRTNQMSNPAAAQQGGSNFFMLYVFSPLMSLWIGYAMPAGLCIYWIINSLLSMVQEIIAGKMLKKDYEEAAENARKQALLDKEEEKRRKAALAAERSKRIEERKKQKGKKKDKAAAPGVDNSASAVGIRAYARGRSYDPARYGAVTVYRDPDHPIDEEAIERARAEREEKRAEAKLEADVTAQVAAEMSELATRSADEVAEAIEAAEDQRDQELMDEAEALAATLNQDESESAEDEGAAAGESGEAE